MRMPCRILVAYSIAIACAAPTTGAQAADSFTVAYAAGSTDGDGRFMGGTELRNLAAYQGKLYAGIGYWEDRPGSEGLQGAQILVLDAPQGRWRIEHAFDEQLTDGRRRHLAVSALRAVTFETDGAGTRLGEPMSLLLASTWDLTGTRQVFSRDPATGRWAGAVLAQDRPTREFLPQVRALGFHRDHQTNADQVFAGDSRGIFSGTYDPTAPGRIRWGSAPELDASILSTVGFPGLGGRMRISSFAEANGMLYAAVGQQIYQRLDGAAPHWHLLYGNPRPKYSQTGLRGLTAIPNASGTGEVLLAAVEGNGSRIVRVDPRDGSEATDLDLDGLLDQAWQTKVSYVIGAYNDMAKVGDALLIGIEAFIPPRSPKPPGHIILDVVNGLEGGAWYLVRHGDGHYDLHQISATLPSIGQALVAPRAILASPFPGDAGIYFAGYDANGTPIHNSAWIVRAPTAVVLSPQR